MQSDYSRPDTAATNVTGRSSMYRSSSDSFAYSVISNKFESTGEVLLLPKVNARRSIKFDKNLAGPKIMAVRETAQWLISNNNRVTDDLSKECRRLDDSYLKWYRKHFNEKKDVLQKVSNLLNYAEKEKHNRCRSYQSCYKNMSSPHSRKSTVPPYQTSPRNLTIHNRSGFFATELPDVEQVDLNQDDGTLEPPANDNNVTTEPQEVSPAAENGKSPTKSFKSNDAKSTKSNEVKSTKGNGAKSSTSKTPVNGSQSVASQPKTPGSASQPKSKTPGAMSQPKSKTPGAMSQPKTPGILPKTPSSKGASSLKTPGAGSNKGEAKTPEVDSKSPTKAVKEVRIMSPK